MTDSSLEFCFLNAKLQLDLFVTEGYRLQWITLMFKTKKRLKMNWRKETTKQHNGSKQIEHYNYM